MARLVVANLYVGNKLAKYDFDLLAGLDPDAAFLCEMTRWWDLADRHFAHTYTGPRDRRKALREVGLATRLPVESVRQVHLSDDTGNPAGQERHAVVARTEIAGVPTALISVHLDAALGYDENMAAHQRALRTVVEIAKAEREAGYAPLAGGDWNDRGRTPAKVTAEEAFAEIGMAYEYHRLDGLAYDPEVWRIDKRRVVDPHGADHKWLVLDVTPREVPEMRFVSREKWNARPGATPQSHPIGETRGVTLHWEGPAMGDFGHAECAEKVLGIQKFHQVSRGWADIAYNAVVCPHGYVFEGRGTWTMSAANGYEAVNDDWYAVCYLGGQGDGFTDEGKRGFIDARNWLVRDGGAGPLVNGHRDHKPTTCPGDEIYDWLRSVNWASPEEDTMPDPKDLWNHEIPEYDEGTKAEQRPARVLLAQAHNRAGDARRAANRAEAAVKALAKALGPEIEAAVEAALADAVVEVDVNVNQPES